MADVPCPIDTAALCGSSCIDFHQAMRWSVLHREQADFNDLKTRALRCPWVGEGQDSLGTADPPAPRVGRVR